MWQKLVAAAFVMTGAYGFGYSICRDMSRDIAELKIEKQMLLYMMGEISYLHRPLEEIFDILSERVEKPFDWFLIEVCTKMRKRNGRSLKDIWNGELESFSTEYGISGRAIAYLERMAGYFECEGDMIQIEALKLLKHDIEQEIAELAEKKRENDRLIRVLSTLAGILCIVLLI
jgi:stage III sporulation protein AB